MAKQAKATLETESLDVAADRGYFNSAEILAREQAGVTVTLGATHFLMKTMPRVAPEMALHAFAYNLTRVLNIMAPGRCWWRCGDSRGSIILSPVFQDRSERSIEAPGAPSVRKNQKFSKASSPTAHRWGGDPADPRRSVFTQPKPKADLPAWPPQWRARESHYRQNAMGLSIRLLGNNQGQGPCPASEVADD